MVTASVSPGAYQAPITYNPVSLENGGSYSCRGVRFDGMFTEAVDAGTLTVLSKQVIHSSVECITIFTAAYTTYAQILNFGIKSLL